MRNRRTAPLLALGLTALTLLSACASGAPAGEPDGSPSETRSVQHALGTSEIPVDPQRVVTTTDQNALLPLLELGYEPVASAGQLNEETGEQTFRRTDGFDTSGIEFVGAYGEPNAEAIAAQRPDLIVGYEFDEDYASQLDTIAPFVAVQIFGRRLPDALLEFAALVNLTDRAEELQAEYDARIDALKERIATEYPELTVSILAGSTDGTFGYAAEGQAIGTVAYDLDLSRPAAQAGADYLGGSFSDSISLEIVDQHDADVIIVVDFSGDSGSGEFSPGTQAFLDSPLVQGLEAAAREQIFVVDGSKSVGAAWARMGTFLDELEAILERDDLVVTGVNAE